MKERQREDDRSKIMFSVAVTQSSTVAQTQAEAVHP